MREKLGKIGRVLKTGVLWVFTTSRAAKAIPRAWAPKQVDYQLRMIHPLTWALCFVFFVSEIVWRGVSSIPESYESVREVAIKW